jgi:Domain of unknown function (DUF4868)
VTNTQDAEGVATQDEAIESLTQLDILKSGVVGSVVLVVNDNGSLGFSRLRPTPRANPALNDVVQRAAGAYSKSTVIPYAPGSDAAEEQIMWLSIAQVSMVQSIASTLVDPANTPLFDPDKAPLDDLRLAAMRVTVDGATAVFLQSVQGDQIVAQSKRMSMIVRKGVVDVPPDGDVLLFNRTVDAVAVGRVVFFTSRPRFERLFGYLQEMQSKASATFASVTAHLRIDGIADMATAVIGSPAMLGKMSSIQSKLDKYPQYVAALTMPKLVDFVSKHPECGVEVNGAGNATQLVFKRDAQHRFKILKLLDDDYLNSQLTTLGYDANSKNVTS